MPLFSQLRETALSGELMARVLPLQAWQNRVLSNFGVRDAIRARSSSRGSALQYAPAYYWERRDARRPPGLSQRPEGLLCLLTLHCTRKGLSHSPESVASCTAPGSQNGQDGMPPLNGNNTRMNAPPSLLPTVGTPLIRRGLTHTHRHVHTRAVDVSVSVNPSPPSPSQASPLTYIHTPMVHRHTTCPPTPTANNSLPDAASPK